VSALFDLLVVVVTITVMIVALDVTLGALDRLVSSTRPRSGGVVRAKRAGGRSC
jgi:hypothetical protein